MFPVNAHTPDTHSQNNLNILVTACAIFYEYVTPTVTSNSVL